MMALHMEFEKYKLEWQLEIQRLELEEFKTEIADKDSARNREISFMQANGGKRDWVQGGLVIATMVLVFASMIFLAFLEIPKANERVFDLILGGVIVSGSQNIYSYFFGSSKGSKTKDEVIKKAMQ